MKKTYIENKSGEKVFFLNETLIAVKITLII